MRVLNFREQLIEALDDAYTRVILSAKYEDGLNYAADIMEEVMAEELGRILTEILLGMSNDLRNTERTLLAEVEEFRERKRLRKERELQEERKEYQKNRKRK